MITKKQFLEAWKNLAEYRERNKKLSDAFKDAKWEITMFGDYWMEGHYVRLLEYALEDDDQYVSWFLYDTYEKGGRVTWTDAKKKGHRINIDTPLKLYNFLYESRRGNMSRVRS
jgi:hypothetical protein